MPMNPFVRDLLIEVAEMFPAVTQKERIPTDELPVDAPNFPHDLEPVIRANPSCAVPSQGAVDWQEPSRSPEHAATSSG